MAGYRHCRSRLAGKHDVISESVEKLGHGYHVALREGWGAYLKKTYPGPEGAAKSWTVVAQAAANGQ